MESQGHLLAGGSSAQAPHPPTGCHAFPREVPQSENGPTPRGHGCRNSALLISGTGGIFKVHTVRPTLFLLLNKPEASLSGRARRRRPVTVSAAQTPPNSDFAARPRSRWPRSGGRSLGQPWDGPGEGASPRKVRVSWEPLGSPHGRVWRSDKSGHMVARGRVSSIGTKGRGNLSQACSGKARLWLPWQRSRTLGCLSQPGPRGGARGSEGPLFCGHRCPARPAPPSGRGCRPEPGLTLGSFCSHVVLGTGGGAGHRPGSGELEPAAVASAGWGVRPLAPAFRPHGRATRLRAPRRRGSSWAGCRIPRGPVAGRPSLPGA